MVTAKLFSFQVCLCRKELVFFKVADEKEQQRSQDPTGFFSLVGFNVQ